MAKAAFDGLIEMIDDLRRMPTEIEKAASWHVQEAAETMASEVRGEYPTVTGHLERGIKVTRVNAFRAVVRSTARHAYIYERGTVARRWASGKGTGKMPAANVFIPAAIKARRHMTEQLVRVVESQTVRGMTGRLTVQERGGD